MKKIILPVIAITLAMTSCGDKASTKAPATDTVTADSVTTAAETAPLDTPDDIEAALRVMYKNPDDVKTNCSASFNSLIDKVNEKDANYKGDIGYIDHILLTQAQDDIRITSITVTNITATTAEAQVETDYEPLKLQLVKENDSWKVDNVNNEREQMTKYLTD